MLPLYYLFSVKQQYLLEKEKESLLPNCVVSVLSVLPQNHRIVVSRNKCSTLLYK